jgi:hypothetical protein
MTVKSNEGGGGSKDSEAYSASFNKLKVPVPSLCMLDVRHAVLRLQNLSKKMSWGSILFSSWY